MKVSALTQLLLYSGLAIATPQTSSYPETNCKAVTFTVNATAINFNVTGIVTTNLTDLITGFLKNAKPIVVSGVQTLAGTYCTPLVKNSNNNKLEMLFGSITADRSDWDAQGGVGSDFPAYKPEMYSWVRYANMKGYATLHLDRLGTGKSSHPDPVLVVQAPYEIALYNQLAKQVRAGKTGVLPRAYSFLIYVGNSYGSNIGTGTAGADPSAYDSYVLTGYSKDVQQDFAGVSLIVPAPAAVVDPARFGTLPALYLTSSSQQGRTNSFFGSKQQVDFEDTVANLFFQRKDVVSFGEFITLYALPYLAPAYTKRVLVLTGEQDQAYCGPGSPVIGPAGCGPLLKETGVLFPKADYNYQSVNRVGHAIQLHTRSQVVFQIAHNFLGGQSYKGGAPL